MLQSIFLWFYCLSIIDAALLILIVSAAYLVLRAAFREKRFWRPVITLLFLAWLAVIAVATLAERTPGTLPAQPELIPFHSYRAVLAGGNREILRSNFMNVVLFYPAGLLTCELLPGSWSRVSKVIFTTALFSLASVGIEFCQYHYALGQAEADDVIHNALGALVGTLVCVIHIRWKPDKSQNRGSRCGSERIPAQSDRAFEKNAPIKQKA